MTSQPLPRPEPSAAGGRASRLTRWGFLLVALLAIGPHLGCLRLGFALDDEALIVKNPRLGQPGEWGQIVARGWRPLKHLTLSLDHALWIHAPVRFDDWHLYASESPVARSARGLVLGAIYSRHGERIASVAQEGLIRTIRPGGA